MSTQHSSVGQSAGHPPSNSDKKAPRPVLHLPTQGSAAPAQTKAAALSEKDAAEKEDIDQVEDDTSAVANFASSEIAAASALKSDSFAEGTPIGASATPDPNQGTSPVSIVSPDQHAAIDRCKAVRIKSGAITKTTWSPKSVEMLSASLEFVTAFEGDVKALDAVRLMLKVEGTSQPRAQQG